MFNDIEKKQVEEEEEEVEEDDILKTLSNYAYLSKLKQII